MQAPSMIGGRGLSGELGGVAALDQLVVVGAIRTRLLAETSRLLNRASTPTLRLSADWAPISPNSGW